MLCQGCGLSNSESARFCEGCGARLDAPVAEVPSHVTHAKSQFVGRRREMDELVSSLDDAIAGRGRLVMLVGEPGIGKTHLAQELLDIAEQRGAQALWGRCYERQGAPPYWPWLQPLRAYVQQNETDDLVAQLGAGASVVADIVPDINERLPDLEPLTAMEPESARFRLFDAVTTFIKNAAADKPMVLILDDLHWADGPSLLLLEFIVREIAASNVLLIGTYRDVDVTRRHPLSQSLGTLVRERQFSSIELKGLNQEEVGRLANATTGVSLEKNVLEAVHGRTDGNPLFVSEIARLLERENVDDVGRGLDIRLPSGIRDVIGRRLDRLSEECNRMLTTASVIGREFDFALLRVLADEFNEDGLLQAIDEALESRVIEGVPGGIERYQFMHALVQQTLSDELSTSRKVRLHARIGEALERILGGNIESHAAELAYHFEESQTLLGSEKMVRYSLIAGEQAMSSYAWEDALTYFEGGLAAKEGQATDSVKAALLYGLGRVQLAVLGQQEIQEAMTNMAGAFDYYVESRDLGRAIAVARYPVQASSLTGHRTGAIQLIARALELVPSDSLEAGQLLCQYGNTLYYETGDYENATKALSEALSIAQREKDAALEMRTLVAAGHAEAAHLHFKESLAYDLRAIELAGIVNEPYEEGHARQEVTAVLHRMGDLDGARRHAEAMTPVAARLRNRTRLWQALQANTVVSALEGDWQTALSLSDRALSISPWDPNLLGYRVLIEYTMGNIDQGESYLDRMLDVMRRRAPGPTFEYAYPAIVIPLAAHISNVEDQLQAAETAAGAVLSSTWSTPVLASLARTGLALLAVKRRDKVMAEEQYAALRPRSGTMIGGLLDSIISADRVLGLLAQATERQEEAAVYFEDALVFCRKAGYRPELAWTGYDYARALLEWKGTGARETAFTLLKESRALSAELGMLPLSERVAALRDGLLSPPNKMSGYPNGLTVREVEVLRLVASGQSNAQIAGDLDLSIRTVERHISNIYVKTSSGGRAQATAFAFTQGLMPDN